MKNKFRFKSLILALLMAVTPVLGVTAQNPFIFNVSATESEKVKITATVGSSDANQTQKPQAEVKSANNKNSSTKKLNYGLILKKSLACGGWLALGFVGAIPIALLGGITGALAALPFGASVEFAQFAFMLGGAVGGFFGAMPAMLNIVNNIDDIILEIKGR